MHYGLSRERSLGADIAPAARRFVRDDPTHVAVHREPVDDAHASTDGRDDEGPPVMSGAEVQLARRRRKGRGARERPVDPAHLDAARRGLGNSRVAAVLHRPRPSLHTKLGSDPDGVVRADEKNRDLGAPASDRRVVEVVVDDLLPRVVVVDGVAAGEAVRAPLAHPDAVAPALALDDEERGTRRARRESERSKQDDREE